jgi:hypothetical protein
MDRFKKQRGLKLAGNAELLQTIPRELVRPKKTVIYRVGTDCIALSQGVQQLSVLT